MNVKKGTESYIVEVMVRDATTGLGKTGIAYGDVAYSYWRRGAATGVNGTCVAMSKGTYADHGWVELDATNQRGLYQFGVPDAALVTGADGVTINLTSADAIDVSIAINLIEVDELGIAKENFTISNTTVDGNTLSGTIKIYADNTFEEGVTTPVYEYEIEATYDANNNVSSYVSRRA